MRFAAVKCPVYAASGTACPCADTPQAAPVIAVTYLNEQFVNYTWHIGIVP